MATFSKGLGYCFSVCITQVWAMPNAVLAAAPGFSVHLVLQQMDMRDALTYASSFTCSSLIKSQLLRLVGSQLIFILQY